LPEAMRGVAGDDPRGGGLAPQGKRAAMQRGFGGGAPMETVGGRVGPYSGGTDF